jgi:hypothetical protein
MNAIRIPLTTTGLQEPQALYLRFRADGEDPEGTVGVLIDLQFLRTQPST